jgi:hypothetical protein
LRADLPLLQFDGALEILLIERGLRLFSLEIGALDRVVELDEELAGIDLLVGFERDVADDAAYLDGEIDSGARADRADRLDFRLPRHRLGHRRGDGEFRLRHIGEILLDRVGSEEVEADNAADNNDDEYQGDDEAFDHARQGSTTSD